MDGSAFNNKTKSTYVPGNTKLGTLESRGDLNIKGSMNTTGFKTGLKNFGTKFGTIIGTTRTDFYICLVNTKIVKKPLNTRF